VLVVVLTGGEEPARRPPPPAASPPPSPAPTASATRSPAPTSFPDALQLGVTEPNPAFLVGSDQPAFARWTSVLGRMRPAYFRLVVDWASLTAPDGSGIDLAKPQSGCMRDVPPCAGWGGVRAQLQALAVAQRMAPGRFVGMAVVTGTPEGLARPASGCERSEVAPRSRPPRADALPAYRAVVRAVLDEAARVGADVPYWSPWNEPNHPYFLSPQRTACAPSAPSVSAEAYVGLARALVAELEAAPGDQRLVLGETAGLFEPKSTTTPAQRFIRALPRRLVCRAAAYGQHGYVSDVDPVGPVVRALRSFRCPDGVPPVWVTETGIKSHRVGACLAVRRRLARWYRDPRVQAAFQYTVREDDLFPTGLVSTRLRRAFPVAGLWEAFGAGNGGVPPRSACRAPASG
jgi:hypothetical protein